MTAVSGTRPEIPAHGSSPQDDPVDRAFELAYFLHGDRETALRIVIQALLKLEGAAAAQDKRLYYRPGSSARAKAQKFRTKVSLEERHLFQRLVCIESEPYERAHERSTGEGPTEEEMVVRYVKQLVQITIKRNSFYVTLGLGRLLYNYTTKETAEMYDALVPESRALKSDDYYRSRKARLVRELKERFSGFLLVTKGPRGEEKFTPADSQEANSPLVRACLGFFVPWGTPCFAGQGHADLTLSETSTGSRAEEHEREIRRIHALVHPDCFDRLTAILSIDSPSRHLHIPRFLLKRDDKDKLPPMDRRSPPGLNREERSAIQDRLEEEARHRRAGRARSLRILVDGIERASWDVVKDARVRLGVDEGAELVEIRGRDRRGEFLLGCHVLRDVEASTRIPASASTIVLEGGQKLSFTVSPSTETSSADGGALVEIAYRETDALRAAALGLRRLRVPLVERDPQGQRPWPLLGPLPTFALLVALGVTLAVYLRSVHEPSQLPGAGSVSIPAAERTAPNTGVPPAVPGPEGGRGPSQPAPRGARSGETAPDSEGSGVTRAMPSRPGGVPLARVRKIAVEARGTGPTADQVRVLLVDRLQGTGAVDVVNARHEADAILNVTVSEAGSRRLEASVGVRLINRDGVVIWPVSGAALQLSGLPSDVTTDVVEGLLGALRKARAKSGG